eukprot:CAMPEP_0170191762 /NCGR_PEP_ID=MMETSP0040_2-20121228/52465_1 /TAXON_ID=641309 /ORGANISM="Lotharella oceanica, Strain CCMP622" /LENGTH=320 /DNA_ID=CAMNT_0010439915 /DNA_START=61 /DNA_END=1020 /DNA_ORIENTATION=-
MNLMVNVNTIPIVWNKTTVGSSTRDKATSQTTQASARKAVDEAVDEAMERLIKSEMTTWKKLPGLKQARSDPHVELLGNVMCVVGGMFDRGAYRGSIECLDLETNEWKRSTGIPTGTGGGETGVVGWRGSLIIAGGLQYNSRGSVHAAGIGCVPILQGAECPRLTKEIPARGPVVLEVDGDQLRLDGNMCLHLSTNKTPSDPSWKRCSQSSGVAKRRQEQRSGDMMKLIGMSGDISYRYTYPLCGFGHPPNNGYKNGELHLLEAKSQKTFEWKSVPPLPRGQSQFGIAVWKSYVYVVGGGQSVSNGFRMLSDVYRLRLMR